ncbi:MAG TPA: SUMF1/EgtB/PvdO family nonheme iron enzyme [Pedomonas sp.]|uniref:formylglycine-generating enzyme family protein n=1 Tax=Pedomonas sp. TaxID=2976421 RepID=UPI002F3EC111
MVLAVIFGLADNAATAETASSLPTSGSPAIKDCEDCPAMVLLRPMTYADGKVRVFYAARTELTWREYAAAVRENNCPHPFNMSLETVDMNRPENQDDYPLVGIHYWQFPCYLDWLNKKTGKNYRLPSGEEWEFLARAGTSSRFPWGNEIGYNNAIIRGHFNQSEVSARDVSYDERKHVRQRHIYPVAKLRPNAWGLYDVIGNASEATTDFSPPFPECVEKSGNARCHITVSRGGRTSTDPSENLLKHKYHWFTASFGYRLILDK